MKDSEIYTREAYEALSLRFSNRAKEHQKAEDDLIALRREHQRVWEEKKALEAALKGLYSECCYAGFDTAKDYAWPGVMKQAKEALTPSETEVKRDGS